jgi:hypothetical protein
MTKHHSNSALIMPTQNMYSDFSPMKNSLICTQTGNNSSTWPCFSKAAPGEATLHFLLDECKGDRPDEAEDPAAGQEGCAGAQARRTVVAAVHRVPAGVVRVQHRGACAPAHRRAGGTGARHVTGGRGACRRWAVVTTARTAQITTRMHSFRVVSLFFAKDSELTVNVQCLYDHADHTKKIEIALTLILMSDTCRFLNLYKFTSKNPSVR